MQTQLGVKIFRWSYKKTLRSDSYLINGKVLLRKKQHSYTQAKPPIYGKKWCIHTYVMMTIKHYPIFSLFYLFKIIWVILEFIQGSIH